MRCATVWTRGSSLRVTSSQLAGQTWNYGYAEAGGVRTVTITDLDGGGRLDGFDGGADFSLDLRKTPEDWSLWKHENFLSIRLIDISTLGDLLMSRKVIRQCER